MSPGNGVLPDGLVELLPGYLGRQRWYGREGEPAAGEIRVVAQRQLHRQPPQPSDSEAGAGLLWAVVDVGGAEYQLLLGERHAGEHADFLNGHEPGVLGAVGDRYYYDATLDPELALALLAVLSDGAETAERVRPVTAEQSNTSLVYDDRLILKLYRQLLDGPNPDVEVTSALADLGFDHVPVPLVTWRGDGRDLAFGEQFLVGGSEGWALALTSLSDFYAEVSADPGEAGGDFAGEATRLGTMTAQLHLALADAFGVDGRALADRFWALLVDSIGERLVLAAAGIGGGIEGAVGPFVDGLRAVEDPGPAIRVHGDYHLGQVMRTDSGWYVLDFEGEPARPVEERRRPTSVLKDVTGMLRSLQYVSRYALSDRPADELDELRARAEAWEHHNRQAFLGGYRSKRGIDALLPEDEATWEVVLAAFEMDKALYELDYERAYRPDWTVIPTAAIVRLLERR